MNKAMINLSGSEAALSRRQFLKHSSLTAAGAAVAASLPFVLTSHAAPDDPIQVALVGCGGRGGGAARDVLEAAPNVKIAALADLFPEKIEKALKNFPDVPAENCFSGFDAYRKAMAVPGVNYVILATPPGFRPMQFKAAVEAGKHVFMEKPVAVDGPGVRSVIETGEMARRKQLCVVAGTQRRHKPAYRECVRRIQDGAIGDLVVLRAYWCVGARWDRGNVGETEMEKQIRNWYHYVWLCGDHIVEQHVHNLDVCNWVMNGHPINCWGFGGRQCRTGPGQIYDHFSIEYEYASGVRMLSYCRQMPGEGMVCESVSGTKGEAKAGDWIRPKQGEIWRAPKGAVKKGEYVQEHTDLIEAIRTGKYVNESKTVAESTLTAIMGREAAYSGTKIEWDTAINWKTSLLPEKLEWGPAPKAEVPMPGEHKMT